MDKVLNFNHVMDRTKTGSMKWSCAENYLTPKQAAANPIPLWVADMDFPAPFEVIEAIQKHSVDALGYSKPTESYFKALYNWQKDRYGWAIQPEWVIQTPGVVTALNLAIQAFTEEGDDVLIQPPVYVHFHEDVHNNHRNTVCAPLTFKDGQYSFDAGVFEQAITPKTKLFILCNPHNPTGNVWSKEDLTAMGEICLKHNIIVISDEIHQDLIFNTDVKHMAFAGINAAFEQNSIICTAPSKTFNVAGLQVANIMIANSTLREKFQQQMIKNGITLVNYLGLVACEAAYTHGSPWLDAMLAHIAHNQKLLIETFATHLPNIKITKTDSLFLTWVDFRSLNLSHDDLVDFLTIEARVWFDNGLKFGEEGRGFMRINVGCPTQTLEQALNQLIKAIKKN